MSEKIVFAFDVDETLDISRGPIPTSTVKKLYDSGYIVGICGNWAHYVRTVPDWNKTVSFIGQFYGYTSKEVFLKQLKSAIQADRYIMIGNDPAHYGNSNDIEAARIAEWEFIREDAFRIENFLNDNMVDVDVDELEGALKIINDINSIPLEKVRFVRDGKPIDVPDKNVMNEHISTGLNNSIYYEMHRKT